MDQIRRKEGVTGRALLVLGLARGVVEGQEWVLCGGFIAGAIVQMEPGKVDLVEGETRMGARPWTNP